jgi:hypothetical protein
MLIPGKGRGALSGIGRAGLDDVRKSDVESAVQSSNLANKEKRQSRHRR